MDVEQVQEEIRKVELPKEKSREDVKLDKLNEVKEKEAQVLKTLRNKDYKSLGNNCYDELDSYSDMVCQKKSYGALIEGPGGIGKSYRILNKALDHFKSEGVFYLNSFSTPQAFYIQLFKARDSHVIIIDDCEGILNNIKCVSMLKGALWDINGSRIVQYMTTKPLQDEYGNPVEREFIMDARIIIITNYLNKKNPHINALLSRINHCRVEIPKVELFRILDEISDKDYPGVNKVERKEVLEYLKGRSNTSVDDMNIRTLFKMFMFKSYVKDNKHLADNYWEKLSDKMLDRDDKYALVEKLVKDDSFDSEEERVDEFHNLTGKGRATYFKLKKEVEARLRKFEESSKKSVEALTTQ